MIPILAALLGHWRRHPVELLTLVAGLAVATALWSGVQALNAEARASYARAEALLGGGAVTTVTGPGGSDVALADYVALRRAGWKVSPVLEGDLRRGADVLRIVGLDPLTLPPGAVAPTAGPDTLRAFLLPPHRALAAPETVARLAAATGLPPREARDDLPPDTLVVDIAVAAALLDAPDRLTRLIAPPEAAGRPLPAALAGRLAVDPPNPHGDLDRLTASFHLNLTAFGALSFVVGLFIAHAAAGLAFEQRRPTFRTLRALGVPACGLAAALLAETLALALAAGVLGIAAGHAIAAALLPDVAASLRSLYGARVPGTLSLGPDWWAAGLGMAVAGALSAASAGLWRAATLPVLAPAQPEAWRAAEARARRRRLAAAALLALAALAALAFGRGLAAGFTLMGGLLLAAALALPTLLAALLAVAARRARGPIAQWFWADARQTLGGLSLALMALLLALAVNIGVGTMVDSFRRTFLAYLDQRLASELYLAGRDDAQAAAIARWLEARPDVRAVLPLWSARTRFRDWPVELYGFRDHATYRDAWPLLAAAPGAWDRVARGEAVLVSEQLARRFGLHLGDALDLPAPSGPWHVPVAAIYPDYGNAEGQVMLSLDALAARWPDLDHRRLGVRADPSAVPRLAADLRAAFPLERAQVVDQRALKQASLRVFDKTFAVTLALNALTFAVAGVALFTSLLTLASARLAQLAPLWALGVTRRRLVALELARAVALAALTAVAALPLGLALAWVLTDVVNVRAFGWRLPIHLAPGRWAALFLLALAVAALAAALPALRMRRATPLDLLRSFSNER
ncbi:MAG: FtsX-like permease family protein [Amaricoccus sp.]